MFAEQGCACEASLTGDVVDGKFAALEQASAVVDAALDDPLVAPDCVCAGRKPIVDGRVTDAAVPVSLTDPSVPPLGRLALRADVDFAAARSAAAHKTSAPVSAPTSSTTVPASVAPRCFGHVNVLPR